MPSEKHCVFIPPGNVGTHLEDDNSLLRVYLSRDGGFSWQEIQSGHWSFQMIALGSIIVMVPKPATVDPVDYLLYVYTLSISQVHTNMLALLTLNVVGRVTKVPLGPATSSQTLQ